MKAKIVMYVPLILGTMLVACEPKPVVDDENLIPVNGGTLHGVYVLNEGGYGQNNASLDYLNFQTKKYQLSLFTQTNPTLIQGLGDVGNDMIVYGSKAYICVNGSGLIEVIDVPSAKHVAQINLSNCRRLCADEGKVYVTSYAGRVEDKDHQLGFVARIDTTSLTILDSCEVGYQPEGMAIVNGKLYVANSGGYVGMSTGMYDNRVSVIALSTFTLDKHLTLDLNPQEILVDSRNQLWISTYGNYADVSANLYCMDPTTETCTAKHQPVTKMTLAGETLYFYATTYDASWKATTSFYSLNTSSGFIATLSLSTTLSSPYGIGVHPQTKELYVADAGNYANPGTLYCFSTLGTLLWQVHTGIAPGHFAFVY